MQRTCFDFDVISGPALPRPVPKAQSTPDIGRTDPKQMAERGDDTHSPAVAISAISRHKAA
jgi:hypothetical protein